jgi:hypothetical protein
MGLVLYAGSLGLPDLLAPEITSREELHALQRDDLSAVGRLLLVLACAGAPPSLDYMAASFSQGLTRTISALIASSQGSSFASWQVRPEPGPAHCPACLLKS